MLRVWQVAEDKVPLARPSARIPRPNGSCPARFRARLPSTPRICLLSPIELHRVATRVRLATAPGRCDVQHRLPTCRQAA